MKTTTYHLTQWSGQNTASNTIVSRCLKPLLLFMLCAIHQCATAQVFWQDNFENTSTPDVAAGSTRLSSLNQGFGTPSTSYFKRSSNTASDISLNASFGTTYASMSGSFIWAGENHDAAGGTENALSPVQTIEWTNIDISGKTSISFRGLFAANNVSISWDNGVNTGGSDPVGIASGNNDYILVEYAINSGSYQTLILFMGDNNTSTKILKEDTNNDGLGDGTALNNTLQEFTKTISGTGTTMKIRLTGRCNGSNEEWAVDNFRLSTPVLPVELIRFDAHTEGGTTHLAWTTGEEKNNKGFQIERSRDGRTFQKIGTVNAIGKAGNYTFTDANPIRGTNYYRLRQIDHEGTETLSKVVSVTTESNSLLSAYPNPVSDVLTIETDLSDIKNESSCDFQIINLLGQTIMTGKTAPSSATRFDVSALREGTYFLKMGSEQVKFMKK
ncbi:MAG: T9SS type A sorting domain-containing protein [Saprospiraceae bacterium]|nr:T9SS type A sorting domain-containing protein [Saprospiraceae bacterium]